MNVLGNDRLRFISSTAGNETLQAPPPAPDEFVLTNAAVGQHVIDGFKPVQDVIKLSMAQVGSFADVQASLHATANGTLINLGQGSSLLLQGIDPNLLHARNFALT